MHPFPTKRMLSSTRKAKNSGDGMGIVATQCRTFWEPWMFIFCVLRDFFFNEYFFLGTEYSGFYLQMWEILEKEYWMSYIMWINATFFGYCKAGCHFKATSHMLLYLRVKFFITIQRWFMLLLNRGNIDKSVQAFVFLCLQGLKMHLEFFKFYINYLSLYSLLI